MGNMITGSGTVAIATSYGGEFISLKADTGNPVLIHSIRLGQFSDPADAEAEMMNVRLSRFTGAQGVANGVAGAEAPHTPGTPSTGVIVHVGATSLSATGVTLLMEDSWNVQAGWLYLPTPEERIWIAPTEGIACLPASGPADELTLTASITFEEFIFV
jgi:hypothetical protein